MAKTAVRTWNNVQLPNVDPALPIGSPGGPFYHPDANGGAFPAGKRSWSVEVDQANVPAGQQYGFHVEFQRSQAWTDKIGAQHPAGEWLPDAGSDEFSGGPIALRGGGSTTINFVSSQVGQPDEPNMPYPSNYRIRVTKMQHVWVWPTITLAATT